ncbi:MAG TPA: putative porin [Pyrinomonadaceae bacterium]|nr:putative porin [Pyrinomonadaceae bacterium]
MLITLRCSLFLFTGALAICFLATPKVSCQVAPGQPSPAAKAMLQFKSEPVGEKGTDEAARLSALEEAVREQHTQLEALQKLLVEQQETIKLLTMRLAAPGNANPELLVTTSPTANAKNSESAVAAQVPSVEDRLKKVEGRISEIGAIKFSGDVRLRSESFFGLSNNLANGNNPVALGNELTPRHRMRVRARLALRGSVGDEFDWGLRFASGSFADNISTNQTLTDFYNRKPFGLDQAFITYKPKAVAGLRLQGGKFEPPWSSTELTIDSDLMVEGFNESYTRNFKGSKFKELGFVAWQLPFLERNSAFVRNADGTVNIERSRRDGRDLALYGGQIRARVEPNDKVTLTLSAADLYFSGTQFISPVQVFGSQLQLPVTITIPATATTPAQTITTQVSIPRDFLVAGNGNLGLTNASNNATNRDGRLASGFNLVDLLAKLELKHSKRWPVTVLLDFVTNTRVRDVVTAGPGGADLILTNHEKHAFWGEVLVGSTRAKGDMQLGYTFMRIEKDAVLTPFNMSDITQQSDMRGHRLQFSYAADPRVTFSVIGIVTQRPNGVLGAFGTTPPGSLNRATTRLQFDTVIKF